MLQSSDHICAFSRLGIHLYDPKSPSTGLNPGSESICFSPLRLSDEMVWQNPTHTGVAYCRVISLSLGIRFKRSKVRGNETFGLGWPLGSSDLESSKGL